MNVSSSNHKVIGYRDKYSDVVPSSKGGLPSNIPMKEAMKTVYEPRKVINYSCQRYIAETELVERAVNLLWRRW